MASTRTAVIASETSATFVTSAAFEMRKADMAMRPTLDPMAANPSSAPPAIHHR